MIAIIDDHPCLIRMLDALLSSYGYRTEAYASAEEFLWAVETTNATCLLVDIELGGTTGIELGYQLLAMGYSFPVIFMTGSREESLQKQALDFGCAGFLHKPFEAGQLIQFIVKASQRS